MFSYVWWFQHFHQITKSKSNKPNSPTHLSVQTHQTHTLSQSDEQRGRRSAVAGEAGRLISEVLLKSLTSGRVCVQMVLSVEQPTGPHCSSSHWHRIHLPLSEAATSTLTAKHHPHPRSVHWPSAPAPAISGYLSLHPSICVFVYQCNHQFLYLSIYPPYWASVMVLIPP